MPEQIRAAVEQVFQSLIASEVVQMIDEDGELHIAADDWTLVLEGDPLSGVMIALDDENGSPKALLRGAISDDALAAMRDLNANLDGKLAAILDNSPDSLAKALSGLLAD